MFPDSEPQPVLPDGSPGTAPASTGRDAAPSDRLDRAAIALDDAHWFPVDLDVQSRVFQLQRLTLHTLEHTTFMDTRMAPQPQPEKRGRR